MYLNSQQKTNEINPIFSYTLNVRFGHIIKRSKIVEFKSVDKHYGNLQVLNSISNTISENKSIAIIGKSGCGKSTLLRCINGMIKPESGSVRVFGEEIDYSNLAPFREKIGYSVQAVGLFPHMTVHENITLLAKLRAWKNDNIEKRIKEVSELTQLDYALLNRFPKELSGGQQQRVGLARALFMDPKLILLDEPFAALDPLTKIDVHQQFNKIRNSVHKSIVLVTHDMAEAITLADEIFIMDAGKIIKVIETTSMLRELNGKSPNDYLLEFLK